MKTKTKRPTKLASKPAAKPAADTIVLYDKPFVVSYRGKDVNLELIFVKLAIDAANTKHPPQNGSLSLEFLKELAVSLDKLGLKGCTPEVAYQVMAHHEPRWSEYAALLAGE